MDIQEKNQIPRLLPAEGEVVASVLGTLLIGLGSFLEEHPDLVDQVSPHSARLLVHVGETLNAADINITLSGRRQV